MAAKNSSTFLQGVIVGIIVGVLISVLMIFITREPSPLHTGATLEKKASPKTPAASVTQNTPDTTPKTPDAMTPAQKESQYDFYKILPGDSPTQTQNQSSGTTQANSPAISGATPSAENTPKKQEMANLTPGKTSPETIPSKKEKILPAGRYWIQTGAFRSKSDAERTKARLAFLGLEATIASSEGWYKVRVGPLDGDQINVARKKIIQNGMEAHLIKEN